MNRIFVEKKDGFNVAAKNLKAEINSVLNAKVSDLRIFLRYDIENLVGQDFEKSLNIIFSEPPVDIVYRENMPNLDGYQVFGIEYLEGQYDQRADIAAECVQMLTQKERPQIKCATIIAIKGDNVDVDAIKSYIINPVESKEACLAKPKTLFHAHIEPDDVATVDGFIELNDAGIAELHKENGFAMSIEDLKFVQQYFKQQHRNPTQTELKVIDTYWSDHCRHTTFLTELTSIKIESDNPHLHGALKLYEDLFNKYNSKRADKYKCLMDIATIAVKELSAQGLLDDLDKSDEINACSIKVKTTEGDYLVMFKNETHNHPTEIEPFGGAATCLGGCIRDPLSGRVYVYQAMRVSGAGDITAPISQKLKGKLAQRYISTKAAAGYSSYGNQIGLATGQVAEVFHSGYVAKRMEVGFVVGAAPAENVVRNKPENNDKVVLLGGATGRDGCGGATGSSKAHDANSVEECGAEVQKGNALTERKIQRLFRNPEASKLIKKCNDFGAGGVSVAIGELADGLDIFLDLVPKKYQGLNGTELAISESQERMAVVLADKDVDKFIKLAKEENLDAVVVAVVTDKNRIRMFNRNKTIVDISRDFLNTNGVKGFADATIANSAVTFFDNIDKKTDDLIKNNNYTEALKTQLKQLNVASQKGMVEMFDSTIGAGTVLMPLGGKNQLTPAIAMAAKLPDTNRKIDTCSVCSYGFNADLSSQSSFLGAVYSVLMSLSKLAATGANALKARLSLQEYFNKLYKDKYRWGEVTAALLGALKAQVELGVSAIGGKDSMSGTYENIDVPPTLISFALTIAQSKDIITNVFTKAGTKLYRLPVKRDGFGMPDLSYQKQLFDKVHSNILSQNITYATVTDAGGAVSAIAKSCMGNNIGVDLQVGRQHFVPLVADIIIGCNDINGLNGIEAEYLGQTTAEPVIVLNGQKLKIDDAVKEFVGTFENVFKSSLPKTDTVENISYSGKVGYKKPKTSVARPRVIIPVFPGTNCEYDTAASFERAGASVETFIINNRSVNDIENSVKRLAEKINGSNIIAFPGGFSGGDEPDGSGKFITATFHNPYIKDAVHQLLHNRDGLILGICNGFQALIKLGLLTYGEIRMLEDNSPTLTFNSIGKHFSGICKIRVCSTKSPWLNAVKVGDEFSVAVSHGEGRYVCPPDKLKMYIENGMIATQYVDHQGNATNVYPFNPNTSYMAIEGVTCFEGRVFGKMGHSERIGKDLYKNVGGEYDMKIFESGVNYFK